MRWTQRDSKWFPHSEQTSSCTGLPISDTQNQLLVKTEALKPVISCYLPFCAQIFTFFFFFSTATPNSALQNCCRAVSLNRSTVHSQLQSVLWDRNSPLRAQLSFHPVGLKPRSANSCRFHLQDPSFHILDPLLCKTHTTFLWFFPILCPFWLYSSCAKGRFSPNSYSANIPRHLFEIRVQNDNPTKFQNKI